MTRSRPATRALGLLVVVAVLWVVGAAIVTAVRVASLALVAWLTLQVGLPYPAAVLLALAGCAGLAWALAAWWRRRPPARPL